MATGLTQSGGSNITGFSAAVMPDKGFQKRDKARIYQTKFGDGYEQRLANGINTLDQVFMLNFKTRPKAEIDDLVTFFVGLNGVDLCRFTYADSNAGGSETAVKAIATEWTQTFDFGDFYSLSVTLTRVYEP
jgi:phage-related protein